MSLSFKVTSQKYDCFQVFYWRMYKDDCVKLLSISFMYAVQLVCPVGERGGLL